MKHLKLTFLFILLIVFKANTQDTICASVINLPLIQQNNPDRYQRIMALEQHTQNYITSVNNGSNNARLIQPNSTIIIPVVVHVLHRGEPVGIGRNISDAQILSQIDVLNEDFRRLNADRFNTPAAFQPVAGDPNFEFRLACIDPNGNLTNGITRTFANRDQFFPLRNINPQDGSINEQATGIKFTAQGGRDAWATDRYLNIWVCDMGNGLIGYGQFPDEYTVKANTDGVVMLFNAFGRVGNVLPGLNLGRVTCHEVGHWLNLRHIWGDANCGNDFVDDTPVQQTSNRACPDFPHVTCNNGPNGDMFMNYMDYTENGCQNIFTRGQNLRMRAVFAQGGPRAAFIDNYFRINQPTSAVCNMNTLTVTNPNCLVPTWTIVSGPATIASGQGTNTIALQVNGNGAVVIRATAGGYIDEKTVYVGTPTISSNNPPLQNWYGNPSTDYNNVCSGQTFYTNMQVDGATSVVWSRTAANPTNTNWSQNGNNMNFYFWQAGQTAVFRITASNTCGNTVNNFGFRAITCGGGGGGCEQYKVSPNPASGSLKVVVPNIPPPCPLGTSSKTKDGTMPELVITEIRLYDNLGNLKQVRKEKSSKQATVNLAGLKSGIYHIVITDGTYKERQKVIIQ